MCEFLTKLKLSTIIKMLAMLMTMSLKHIIPLSIETRSLNTFTVLPQAMLTSPALCNKIYRCLGQLGMPQEVPLTHRWVIMPIRPKQDQEVESALDSPAKHIHSIV